MSFKRVVKRCLPIDPILDVYYSARDHRRVHGALPRVLRPRTFSDKICRRRMFDRRAILTQFADKYGARDYIAARLSPDVLPRLLAVSEHPETVPWRSLPPRYVLKATHGSGWVRVVDGNGDPQELIDLCSRWLGLSYYKQMREWPYKNIVPRIIVEEFIDDGSGGPPPDYKFFVFDGVPAFVQVDGSRFTKHLRSFYDLSWTRLPFTLAYPPIPTEVPKPPHLASMTEAASILGRGMDFVRVDLYDTPDRFFVGELTTTPGAGLDRFSPVSMDEEVGRLWKL